MIKGQKWYKWFIWEMIATLSNKPSYFASKRLERFALFWLAYWIVIGFVIRNWEKLTPESMLMIVGTLLGFGAWNAVQIRKDMKETPAGAVSEPKVEDATP